MSARKAFLFLLCLLLPAIPAWSQSSDSLTTEHIAVAEDIFGLEFTAAERDSMLETLRQRRQAYQRVRDFPIANSTPPALIFNPLPAGMQAPDRADSIHFSDPGTVRMPANESDLAFYTVTELAALLRSRQITSVRLTQFFLDRLRKYGPELECVITLTDSLALAQARRADEEIAAGTYRGLLHGIPYGAKDLLAVRGYKTTWGAAPYRDQVIESDATVIKKLEQAGAVLVAK
ncbi:MAG TPA: amidase, partial [Bacteroidetes bacterium]|nr:amidase [Bacteroidota bacterium]